MNCLFSLCEYFFLYFVLDLDKDLSVPLPYQKQINTVSKRQIYIITHPLLSLCSHISRA